MFTRSFYAIILLLLVLVLAACSPGELAKRWHERAKPVTVTVLHTNDFHSQLEPYSTSDEPEQGGATRKAALVEEIRAEKGEDNVLLLSAGDYFQGSLFYNIWQGSAEIMVMNHLRYDVATLGNHEFDLGAKELARALRGDPIEVAGEWQDVEPAEFLIVGSNVDISNEPELKGHVFKRAVLKKGRTTYGFVGLTTDTTAVTSDPGDTVSFLEYLPAVQAQVAALQAEGVNKIFLLSHYGYKIDVAMAPKLSGVDMIVSGHDHALLGDVEEIKAMGLPKQVERVRGPYPTVVKGGDGKNTLVVSAMAKGRWMGNIEVTFDARGEIQDGAWQAEPIFMRGCEVINKATQEKDCSQAVAEEDPVLAQKVARYHKPVAAFGNEVIGEAAREFMGRKTHYSTQGPFVGDLLADIILAHASERDGADVALVNRGGIRDGMQAGTVRFKDINRVFPFPNTVTVVELSGAELLAALEHGISHAGGKSWGAFPHVAGMSGRYCADENAACVDALLENGRVTALSIDGEPVNKTARYRLASSNYLVGGGDGYALLRRACETENNYCRDAGDTTKDVVANWFRAHSPVSLDADARLIPE